ncbi:hypothetical protein HYDPIDRAFT_102521 [Hydnomerulius pinastri MD-312]|uniref:BTB domain-containing protein n=1 Tax=Hydnomerulius pinastri MD-312 TaxID=994086 RepID=A0A0C9VLL4_9AGAM|nr:hypothetical protein HYDPIDRAFT_102521 [Hydnomerulius pinastri MD-312]
MQQDDCDVVVLPEDHVPGPSRYMKLWFSDGNVVLRTKEHMMLVHRSLLSVHSRVLRDMFTMPQPPGEELRNGHPVIDMPDESNHLIHMLTSIYNPYLRAHLYDFDFLVALLRISTKYEVTDLRQTAVDRLQLGLPTTLQAFDDPTHAKAREEAMDNAIQLVNLVRETNCPELLPCAFYYCTQLPTTTVLEGDGVHSLSWPDVAACLKGRELLFDAQRNDTHRFMFAANGEAWCSHCDYEVEVYGPHPSPPVNLASTQTSRPICLSYVPTDELWDSLGGCDLCIAEHKSLLKYGREGVWKKLPSMFGLGTWEELVKTQYALLDEPYYEKNTWHRRA